MIGEHGHPLVRCEDEHNNEANGCLQDILPEPGVHGKRTGRARQYCHSWTKTPTLSVYQVWENLQCQDGDHAGGLTQANGTDRDRGDLSDQTWSTLGVRILALTFCGKKAQNGKEQHVS